MPSPPLSRSDALIELSSKHTSSYSKHTLELLYPLSRVDINNSNPLAMSDDSMRSDSTSTNNNNYYNDVNKDADDASADDYHADADSDTTDKDGNAIAGMEDFDDANEDNNKGNDNMMEDVDGWEGIDEQDLEEIEGVIDHFENIFGREMLEKFSFSELLGDVEDEDGIWETLDALCILMKEKNKKRPPKNHLPRKDTGAGNLTTYWLRNCLMSDSAS
jgi:hypothetical protein